MSSKKEVPATIESEVREVKCKEFLQYKFTDAELKEISQSLARATSEKTNIENEKKAVTSEYKAKVDGKAAEIEVLANQINTGSEYRYIPCIIKMNTPEVGKKTMTRTDNNETVWEKPMTPEEMQLKLYDETIADDSMIEHSRYEDNNI